MQAIITKYFPFTNTKPARIKASCARGSMFVSVHSDKMIQSVAGCDEKNHVIAAQMLRTKFLAEDEKRGIARDKNNWSNPFVTGSLSNQDYVHIFIK